MLTAVKARYHVTISRAQVKSSSKSLFFKLTADIRQCVFNWIEGSSQVITLREDEGEHKKAKFWQNLNPDALLTFCLTYSLHNRVLESP